MRSIYLLVFIISLISCQQERHSNYKSMSKDQAMGSINLELEEQIEIEPPRTHQPSQSEEFDLEKGSKIIKSGRLDFEVSAIQAAKQKVDSLISYYGAYYENEQFSAQRYSNNYSLQVRIPIAKFDSLVSQLESGIGSMKDKNINARDVTEEYVDLKIRLDNKLAYLDQYNAVLKKANSIKEILQVREQIRVLEEEIESKKGRLRYLDDKVKYSVLNIELSELIEVEYASQPNFGRRLKNAFKNGIEGFLNFIIIMVNLWPFLILMFLLWIMRKRIFRIFKRKRD